MWILLKIDLNFLSIFKKRNARVQPRSTKTKLENAVLIASERCIKSFTWRTKLILAVLEITQIGHLINSQMTKSILKMVLNRLKAMSQNKHMETYQMQSPLFCFRNSTV